MLIFYGISKPVIYVIFGDPFFCALSKTGITDSGIVVCFIHLPLTFLFFLFIELLTSVFNKKFLFKNQQHNSEFYFKAPVYSKKQAAASRSDGKKEPGGLLPYKIIRI